MTPPRTIRINQLVIDGIDPHQRAAFVTAFTAELTRLLREDLESAPERRHDMRIAASPAEAGQRTAAAVYARVVRAC